MPLERRRGILWALGAALGIAGWAIPRWTLFGQPGPAK